MPDDKGISEKYSPRDIFTGRQIDYTKHCKVIFGAYIKYSKYAVVKNDMKPWTYECISLGPSGNIQGSTKYFDTLTDRVLYNFIIE